MSTGSSTAEKQCGYGGSYVIIVIRTEREEQK
jgi:hypothetical protein